MASARLCCNAGRVACATAEEIVVERRLANSAFDLIAQTDTR
jgi:hypothetical protein